MRYLDGVMSSFEQKGKIFINFLLISFRPFSSASLTFYKINLTAFSLSSLSSTSIYPSLFFLLDIPEFFLILTIYLLASSIILEHIQRRISVDLSSCLLREINLTAKLKMKLPYCHSTIFFIMDQFLKLISKIRIILSLFYRDQFFCTKVGIISIKISKPVLLLGSLFSRQLEKLMHYSSF